MILKNDINIAVDFDKRSFGSLCQTVVSRALSMSVNSKEVTYHVDTFCFQAKCLAARLSDPSIVYYNGHRKGI